MTAKSDNNTLNGLGQRLFPGPALTWELNQLAAPVQLLPLGSLSHHFITLINHFWRQIENDPLDRNFGFRDVDFPNIITLIELGRRSNLMTPVNLGRGFDKVTHNLFEESTRATSLAFEWINRSVAQGVTKTLELPLLPSTKSDSGDQSLGRDAVAEASWSSQNSSDWIQKTIWSSNSSSNSAVNGADVRTLFTGTAMESSPFLLLINNAFDYLWSHTAQDPISPEAGKRCCVYFAVQDAPWRLEISFLAIWRPDYNDITWEDIAARLLRMFQLPAYLQKWETFDSQFFIDEKQIASVRMWAHGEADGLQQTSCNTEYTPNRVSNDTIQLNNPRETVALS